ncbi:arylsulfatase [Parabacteroides faecis]|uniref:sulfatase family protein n=1 Tax=Parabacteroides faecis TaxID=1217282 RepID=UPI002164AF42|nr:arylsulfatase [Parabacteroides faecis]UVQ44720.1 arylsulfatase [Parabacteroides faecis]
MLNNISLLKSSTVPLLFLTSQIGFSSIVEGKTKRDLPNIIVILADDLGYGDVSSYGAIGLQTPNIDRIAKSGIRFTNGYATSATSTPSRYALMTGLYPWKNKNARVLPGDAPLIIPTDCQTLPQIMREAGYVTAAIGKWHLGLGNGSVDWNQKITPNPNDIGFDYSYIQAATNDRVPCVFVENGLVDGLDVDDPIYVSYKENFPGEPSGKDNPELLKMHPSHGHDMAIVNNIPRIGYMKGGKRALWTDETMAEIFVNKATDFLQNNQKNRFFMYFGLHQPHVPRVPNERFVGKSGMGPRGDAILEADWEVGVLLDELDRLGMTQNTLIIFSSDNGPILDDGYKDMAMELVGTHKPAGLLRGGKNSLFDGGTRVPFMISWPETIIPTVSDALVCQMDILASLADLLKIQIRQPKDSQNLLPVFMGQSKDGREDLILEGVRTLAYRHKNWIMIPPHSGASYWPLTSTETGCSQEYQLYNLLEDIHQDNNLLDDYPDLIAKLKERFLFLIKGAQSDVLDRFL